MRVLGLFLGGLLTFGLVACLGEETENTDRSTALGQNSEATDRKVSEEPTSAQLPVLVDSMWPTDARLELMDVPPPTEIPITPEPTLSAQVAAASAPPAPTAPPPTEEVTSGNSVSVLITFYYCERTVERSDDGGGYCDGTASGVKVHPGSAACPHSWMGRKFVIPDDPNGLVYTCEDTGGGVNGNHVDIWFYTNGEGWSSPITGRGRTIIWQD